MTAMYNKIGNGYDATRCVDPEILQVMARLLSIHAGGVYVDVGCGTGNYTVALSSVGGEWCAFDQSEFMIEQAKAKEPAIDWRICDVVSTPYQSATFDSALCSLAIHHFPDLENAFKEVARILRPSGHFVIFTSTPEQMANYWLNHYFPSMLSLSMAQMPSLSNIQDALNMAKLNVISVEPYAVSNELKDLFLYSGKRCPHMYLSESVRAGISSFRNFCTERELTAGLSMLKRDIESGVINRIIKQYENNAGDYCFIVAKKGE
ncbi:hypothetical protein CBP51_07850 [Cellvibrio mixtus]|uniref:Methyltransferase type 11 domain-containing protein n=1 Tax=Cellvibrio mixtus TaxID=39650 RepID=A0A266QAL9_9GAMM|nr:class I SAM-dependent methyltransferase [Cellvibrio mixtus]OZY86895.1 hypothetical protein CBP51_07850 [Cellvibrio mixtus]